MNLPTDLANLALDAIGSEITISDLEDGTREAQVILRSYRECLAQLLRGAHWQFARKQSPLLLLADATGQDTTVGNIVPTPWVYEYAYPNDCCRAIYVPYMPSSTPIPGGNYSIPSTPLTTGTLNMANVGQQMKPARFLVMRDTNYPPVIGQQWWEVQGVSPSGRTVICTNVPNAQLVYTSMVDYPSEFDHLFRAAFISYLAQAIALPISKDKKYGMMIRRDLIATVKAAIEHARLADGNETWSTTDHYPDWLRARNSGNGRMGGWGGDQGDGCFFLPWQPLGFADGSAF